jgi:hypothetical protein
MAGRYNALFLCTGTSARSIMADAIMNKKRFPTFAGYSAGSHPKSEAPPVGQTHQLICCPCVRRASIHWRSRKKSSASGINEDQSCASRPGTLKGRVQNRRCFPHSSRRSVTPWHVSCSNRTLVIAERR